jgi:hypothetical protein
MFLCILLPFDAPVLVDWALVLFVLEHCFFVVSVVFASFDVTWLAAVLAVLTLCSQALAVAVLHLILLLVIN